MTQKLVFENTSLGKKIWFLEYSIEQDCFHIDTLGKILYNNRLIAKSKRPSGYIIIDAFMSYSEAVDSMKYWKEKLKK